MNYNIQTLPDFDKQFKRLYKKYKTLKSDLLHFIGDLQENPYQGVDLGSGVRKIRMAITAKARGKSHGARIITYTVVISEEEGIITLLSIYDKAEQESISVEEIKRLIEEVDLNEEPSPDEV
ncbi:type II toxin-antitoxin system RelE/ParE family toxin [Bacteroides sp. 519]|uniref:type II toxin-antitoxin system RelE/ParE family toxin n=1 Tax=Bacteroides sp. 519 TaxID=2302937 RepID=UPI0013D65D31|nr:type II toxin-antitoxin system RelE/ParE family toxin [Bacteroides sp. 519]NDV60340.1 addiction module toxin RelE [Bacteroides sp. 519]